MNYTKINNYVGWAIFIIASIVFLGTIEPTASLWDCGEYIATAYKLEVGHPPGAPLFMMLGRIFSAFVAPENAAMMINAMSGLSSAFGVLFLFWCITMLAKKAALRDGGELTKERTIAIMGSGIVGALAFTFTDSFWFSAVEGEVYAMSAMFTSATFWAILKWEQVAHEPRSDRWLVLIAYLIGLSIGVHLLNLLAIPAVAYVYYFKRHKTTPKGFIITGFVGLAILVLVQNIIIPGVVSLAAWFEITMVNSIGLPFNSGALVYGIIIIGLIVLALRWTRKKGKALLNTAVLCFAVLLIGYSTFAMIIIRSNANTPIDENNPENLVSLLAYLNREQYGTWPITYGPYWNSPRDMSDPASDGTPVYSPLFTVVQGNAEIKDFSSQGAAERYIEANGGGMDILEQYKITDDRKDHEPNYDPEFCTVFPRMYSVDPAKTNGYKSWSGYQAAMDAGDYSGRKQYQLRTGEVVYMPTFLENLTFFWDYQVEWMYWRYFMWNFSGRQNDIQGHGNILDGNWVSGLNFIDNQRLGPQEFVPQSITNNRGYNRLFMLPLLIGLIGMIFQLARTPKDFTVVMLLFMLTGFAIIIYLNQKPMEPRERDYAYAASFMTFAIWIGMGVYALFDAARNLTMAEIKRVGLFLGGAIVLSYGIESIKGGDHVLSYSLIYLGVLGGAMTMIMFFLGKKMQQGMVVAALPIIMGLSAPMIMAAEGWNDHDRSGRYTARDLAKNYLDSCAPNAILFTNGDNDTFPLWYVQEVEGYRTDVRVCNLSLLSTDWYISEMKMQAYDSDPIPFGMTEDLYIQGTRDFVEIVPDEQDRYMNITQAMQFIYDNNNKTRSRYTGEDEFYFPTRNFVLPVDKDKILANGIVDEKDSHLIENEVRWSISGGYVTKSTLMVLDLLANFNWDRPIYFASTSGIESYAGLQNYFQLEGLAYKFVPIRTESSGNQYMQGRVNTDAMYENYMNKFVWEGLNDPDVYLSYYDIRMTGNYRAQFHNLANWLLIEAQQLESEAVKLRGSGLADSLMSDSLASVASANTLLADEKDAEAQEKYTKAEAVLDKSLEVLPESNVPYTTNMILVVRYYHDLGATEKAHAVNARLAELFMEDLTYYSHMNAEQQAKIGGDYQRVVGALGTVVDYLVEEEDLELARKVIACVDQNLPALHAEDPSTALLILESQYAMGETDAADMRANAIANYYIGYMEQLYADPAISASPQADDFVLENFRIFNTVRQIVDTFSENADLKAEVATMWTNLQEKEQARQMRIQQMSGGQ